MSGGEAIGLHREVWIKFERGCNKRKEGRFISNHLREGFYVAKRDIFINYKEVHDKTPRDMLGR